METSRCASSEPYALRVLGDSMLPEFKDGSIIIVDPAGVIANGSYVVAHHGREYIFRQLIVDAGRYSLKTLAGSGDPIAIADLAAIKGVVVQQAGKRRADRKHYI